MTNPRPTTRHGRALIECIVAALLLAIAALGISTATRGTLALAGDATLISHAHALATSHAEDLHVGPCGASHQGTASAPGLSATWLQASAPSHTNLHIDVTLLRSPIAFNPRITPLAIDVSRPCD